MYIKLDESMSLVVTVNEPIYRGDNLNRKIIYLVPVKVGDVDVLTAKVYLSYIRADGAADVVILERTAEKYKEAYFQYVLPVSCKLTKYPGEVCTWIQIYSGTPSNPTISKSGECMLYVQESKNMDEYLGDCHMTALYQLHKQMDDSFASVDGAIDAIIAEKADNILFNSEDSTIQLTANGIPIGDKASVSAGTGMGIKDMQITVDGELIVSFDNDTIKNLGRVVGNDGVVYVPHVDNHKVLTFTIEKDAGEIPPPTDLNPNDEWGGVNDDTVTTDYVWETIEHS